jgi:hypothetical protein
MRGIKMPLGFRKKKKKPNLPKPPSFSEEEEEVSLLQQELILAGKPIGSKYRGPPKSNEFAGPPRTTELKGPPLKSPQKSLGGHPNLPPPPAFSTGQQQPPPSIYEKPVEKTTSLFGNEAITDDILGELKQKKFGSGLEKTPTQKIQHKTVDELARRHFQETKKNYIDAGQKHFEMNFHDNASINFACAILCDYIADGVESARRTMSQLSSGMPSSIRDNIFYESTRLLIEAARTKSFPFLTKAEKTFMSNIGKLYPEDAAIVETALKTAKKSFGIQ